MIINLIENLLTKILPILSFLFSDDLHMSTFGSALLVTVKDF